MRSTFLYDQGSARISEDGIVFQPPHFYGALDGVSGIYLPEEGPRLFGGRTGGQLASYIVSRAFGSALAEEPLESILRRANTILRKLAEANRLSLQASELLPSAVFAIARVSEESVNIIQAGDSLAVWSTRNGMIGGTPNRAFDYEADLRDEIALLRARHGKDKQRMWEDFRPSLANKRRANINTVQGGFASLNGQPEAENFWQVFSLAREEIRVLILFSDGFVPFRWTQDEMLLAERVLGLYQKGGMQLVLDESRAIAELEKDLSHEDQPEATAIAIEF